jgi:hypothetical protein
MPHWTLALVVSTVLLVSQIATGAAAHGLAPLAFPGAVGFGAVSDGGRGGDVYHVTTLAGDGPGSLREGIETATGARTIVFEISGTIDLQSTLRIRDQGFMTLAGQTARGGITLRGYPFEVVRSNDIIIRYLRFRPGDINARGVPGKPSQGNGDLPGGAADALSILDCDRVIVDHVSASWSMDETLSVTKSTNVTVQHSIISESLLDSFHPEGFHGRGSLVRGEGREGYTFYRNLWAHHNRRSPALGGQQDPPPPGVPGEGLDVDVVGNVIYDWGLFASHILSEPYTLRINLIANTYIAGPSKVLPFPFVNFEGSADEVNVYRSGNQVDDAVDGLFEPLPLDDSDFFGPYTFVAEPFPFDRHRVPVRGPTAFYRLVLRGAGASHARDDVDRRIIDQVRTETGSIIDSQDDVGGWPEDPPQGFVPVDTDRDGMSDRWERRHWLDPRDPSDGNDVRRWGGWRGYTNLERYLHSLTPRWRRSAAMPKRSFHRSWSPRPRHSRNNGDP